MKHLHRAKAIESYKGASLVLSQGLVYPAYMLLKESVRGTLAYINEDIGNFNYSDKTKLKTLLEDMPVLIEDGSTELFQELLRLESEGLEAISNTDIELLKRIKKALKKVIGVYLGVNM